MSKRVQVILDDKMYAEIASRNKNDSMSVKELMMLGLECEKKSRRKYASVYKSDLSDDDNLYWLSCYAQAKGMNEYEFIRQIKKLFVNGELKIENGKIKKCSKNAQK